MGGKWRVSRRGVAPWRLPQDEGWTGKATGEARAGAVEVQAKWKKLRAWAGAYTLFRKDLTTL